MLNARYWIVRTLPPLPPPLTAEQKNQNARGRNKTAGYVAGRNKMVLCFCPREEKNKGSCNTSKQTDGTLVNLMLVSSSQQMKLVDLGSFLSLGWLFPRSGWDGVPLWLPHQSQPIGFCRLSDLRPKPSQTVQGKKNPKSCQRIAVKAFKAREKEKKTKQLAWGNKKPS